MNDEQKNQYEELGAIAFRIGKQKHENPFATKQQREDMKEFAPWTPAFSSEDNLPAYYWENGWENEQAEPTK